jgi:hypothetical protein
MEKKGTKEFERAKKTHTLQPKRRPADDTWRIMASA